MHSSTWRQGVRNAVFLFSVVVLAVLLLPGIAYAEQPQDIVRVGWYESQFNTMDENGRRSGYTEKV